MKLKISYKKATAKDFRSVAKKKQPKPYIDISMKSPARNGGKQHDQKSLISNHIDNKLHLFSW